MSSQQAVPAPPILITGAAQRSGYSLAKHWLAKGQAVIFSYRTFKPGVNELTALGAVAIQADFATDEGIFNFINQVKAQTPSLRAVIHNASDWATDEKQPEAAAAIFKQMFQVHQQAPFLINLGLESLLLTGAEQTGQMTDIIHLTDDAVRRGSSKHSAYVASKAALENLTLSFASRFAPQIKVNAIAPALLAFNKGDTADYQKKALAKSLLGIEPGFIALTQTVEFLLKQPYMTGAILPLNGGRHLQV
ncbi:dihydromonapterin reductase [Marinospirillum insulare]|uniref:Dihydromonapterin reductase n=1 Tax=Marinospirillum insulare TaxID=217169 RepID=A0ABQ5ZVC0_9GAMM|nr:dihydromonapterin reductase [Marinospirillum insulare]GLR63377.1 short-chain dehydrogenase [Marinospirillum insulare]